MRTALEPWRLPGPVSRAVALDVGGRTLLAGGLTPGDRSTDQVLSIDAAAGTVRRVGTLAQAVHDAAGGVLHGRAFLLGGGGATELASVQSGDTGRWRIVGQLPGGTRSDLSVVGLGSSLLVVGGYDGSRTPTSILTTSDGRHFAVLGRLPAGVRYAGTARVGGHVWILGGEVGRRELTEMYEVDTNSGHVADAGRMPFALGHEAVLPVGHRLLVLGGRTSVDTTTARMWWFDTDTRRWARAGRLPIPVADAPFIVSGSHAWLFGGEAPDFTDRVIEVGWG